MFEKFSDQARRIIVLTQEEARERGHGYIGAEHMLLAVLRACEIGSAATTARALAELAIDPASARASIALTPGTAEHGVSSHIPFTKQARKALENSLREARSLGHEHIEPSDLLLSLTGVATDDPESPVGTAVTALGLTQEKFRRALRAGATYRTGATVAPHFTPQALKALARANAEAREADRGRVDTRHLLLGLLTEEDEFVHPALQALGVDAEQLAAEVRSRPPREQ
ncbi:ATP-dependent Clp protease ATP-binding subunit ClpC [Nocardia tenerifensis]|uniref:ATP-dependent Clp protease ATP-binding subunit ClpC n=1 Tax=Nocardia tenerifensis TaxID=228006 RepID=A0A318JQR8_9NOCA|nr:Clp protease N-terminal domain-containing protein [Nocardia tenerifensis]PXX56546.1 ATP-dependent Clp protease ATP-binding subunit ClpC [Nocardia tenerifensis]